MKKTSIGLIGLGRIGHMHGENLCRFFPNYPIKTVVDKFITDEKKAWAENWELGLTDDINDVLNDSEIPIVVVACSTPQQAEVVNACLNAGKKVFCEKPLGVDMPSIQSIIDTKNATNGFLQVGFNRRFDANFQKVKEAISQDKVGDIHLIKIVNRDPKRPRLEFIPDSGGLHMDFTVHDFDMVRFLSGLEIDEIYSMGAALVDPQIAELNDVDTAITVVRLSNGAMCVIDNSRETHYGYDQRIEVFGSKGSFKAVNNSDTYTEYTTPEGVLSEPPQFSFVERYKESYVRQFAAFFEAIEQGRPAPVGPEDSISAIEAALVARHALEAKTPVNVAPYIQSLKATAVANGVVHQG